MKELTDELFNKSHSNVDFHRLISDLEILKYNLLRNLEIDELRNLEEK